MRAFVAMIPPAGALAELDAAVEPLRVAHPGLRWTPAAQWHLTLAFLGEVDERTLPDLGERLARAARRYEPTALALGGGGRFGDRVLWIRVQPAPDGEPVARESPSAVARLAGLPGDRRSRGRASPDDRASTGRVARLDSTPPGESPVSAGRLLRSDASRPGAGLPRLAASVTAAARRCGIAVDDRPYRPHLTLARGRDGTDLRPVVAALAEFAGSPWTADALRLVRSRLGAGPGGTALHEVVGVWPLGQSPRRPDPTQGRDVSAEGGSSGARGERDPRSGLPTRSTRPGRTPDSRTAAQPRALP